MGIYGRPEGAGEGLCARGRVFRYYALVYPVEYTLRYSTG